MEISEVLRPIKKFSKLANNSSTQELPVITVNKFADRTDSTENIVKEIEQTGLSKEINLENSKYLVGSTRAASPHTPISVKKEGQDIPLHYIMWMIKKGYQGAEPSKFSDLANLSTNERREILDSLGKSTYQTIKEIEELAEGISTEELLRVLKIYGVIGHTPFSERMETGLGRGPQSNPNPHFHLAVLTPETLKQNMENKPASSAEVLKQVSPFDSIFFKTTKEAIVRKLQNEYGEILDVKTVEDHSKHPEFGGISFFDGYNLKFKKPAEFAEAMDILTKFVS